MLHPTYERRELKKIIVNFKPLLIWNICNIIGLKFAYIKPINH